MWVVTSFSARFLAGIRMILRQMIIIWSGYFWTASTAVATESSLFFPRGIFLGAHPDYRLAESAEVLELFKKLRAAGFNTVVMSANIRELDLAADTGLKVITYTEEADWVRDSARVMAMDQHPSLLAWYIFDEPERVNKINEACERYRFFKHQHPLHKPLAVSAYLPKGYRAVAQCSDIMMPDPYVFGSQTASGRPTDLRDMANRLQLAQQIAKEENVRLWVIPQLYAWHPYFKRPPTPTENIAQHVLSILMGAEGLVGFAWNSGAYYPNPPLFEPLSPQEARTPWQLEEYPELIASLTQAFELAEELRKQGGSWSLEKQSTGEGTREEEELLVFRWAPGPSLSNTNYPGPNAAGAESRLGKIVKIRWQDGALFGSDGPLFYP